MDIRFLFLLLALSQCTFNSHIHHSDGVIEEKPKIVLEHGRVRRIMPQIVSKIDSVIIIYERRNPNKYSRDIDYRTYLGYYSKWEPLTSHVVKDSSKLDLLQGYIDSVSLFYIGNSTVSVDFALVLYRHPSPDTLSFCFRESKSQINDKWGFNDSFIKQWTMNELSSSDSLWKKEMMRNPEPDEFIFFD